MDFEELHNRIGNKFCNKRLILNLRLFRGQSFEGKRKNRSLTLFSKSVEMSLLSQHANPPSQHPHHKQGTDSPLRC